MCARVRESERLSHMGVVAISKHEQAQLQTEIDIKRAAGWSSADLRLLTARQRMFEREIQVYQAELASFSPSLTRLSSSYGWISAHRNY